MIQTIVQIGNSLGVTIPSNIRKDLGLKKGSKVIIERIPESNAVVLRKAQKEVEKGKRAVSKEFKKWLEEVLKEDAEILDELSVR